MFGHQDDQNDHHHHDDQQLGNILSEPVVDGVLGSEEHDGAPVVSDDSHFNPALPTSDHDQPGNQSISPTDEVVAPVVSDDATPAPAATPVSSDLLDIKQQALTELSPLVGHLDQSPEEKFRTTMMMIQASDNQDLIKTAYESAQAIQDEKVKAQALLDIVNEINYFTTQNA